MEGSYINAILADATYALESNALDGITGPDLENLAELNERMTPTLAEYIGKNFTVVTHIETSDVTGSGFDATAWRANNADGSPNPNGKLYISMQGTAGVQDFLSDIDLALTANARNQIVDMVNWWFKITTPVGQTARQIQLEPQYDNSTPPALLGSHYATAPEVPGTGQISAADLARGIEVNGHSLGGYLATVFTRLFGAYAHVEHTSTYNSAGFAPGSEVVFAELENLIGPSYGLGRFPNASEQTNYFAANGINVTTNSLYFNQAGQRVELSQEESTGVPNHYMYKLTDLLALGVELEKLDPTFSFSTLNALVDLGSNNLAGSLEGVLDALHLMLNPAAGRLAIGDVSASAQTRVEYHEALTNLQTLVSGSGLAGKLTLNAVSPNLALSAKTDFGAFLALHTLSPLVISSTDSQALAALKAMHPTVSADWQADMNARLYGDTDYTYSFSEQWYADRSLMLGLVIQRNLENGDNHFLDRSQTQDWRLQDFQTDTTLYLNNSTNEGPATESYPKRLMLFGGSGADALSGHDFYADRLYGGLGNDTVIGLGGADHLEGNLGADLLQGDAGNDTLLGGTGNDELHGGANDDLLQGGAGADTYVFDGSAGNDTVIDADGGVIRYQSHVLSGGPETSAGSQEWKDNHATYRLITQGSAQHLRITVGAGTVIIRDWTPGHFGITLGQAAAPAPAPPSAFLIEGDLAPVDTDPAAAGVQVGYDALGNVIVSTNASAGRDDVLYDGAGNDELRGHAGADVLNAHRGGHDLLDGGAGDDALNAGQGDDTLLGGDGRDRLFGEGGDDRLHAHALQTQAQLAADHTEATEDSNNEAGPGDLLGGGEGSDWAVGHRRADLIYGGAGKDTLWGGAGDDILFGDTQANSAQANWSVQRTIEFDAEGNLTTYDVTTAAILGVPADPQGHADVLDGGAGSDWLLGEGGQDQLHGGSGDDALFGGGDSDWLVGGTGADVLVGDQSSQTGPVEGLDYGHDLLEGGAGNDTLYGDAGHDVLLGGDNDDQLVGDGRSISVTSQGDDHLDGGSGNDTLYGFAGNDTLLGGADADTLIGDMSQDILAGQHHGNDELDGGSGADSVFGYGGSDTLRGGTENDFLNGDAEVGEAAGAAHHGSDQLDGGAGDDVLYGGGGSDTLLGGVGDDILHGDLLEGLEVAQQGDDVLDGGDGNDSLTGGGGADTLTGGVGVDLLMGGAGDDTYVFRTGDSVHDPLHPQQSDVVQDDEGRNLIRFEGINSADVSVQAVAGAHLRISWGTNNRVVVFDGLGNTSNRYAFADGAPMTHRDLIGRHADVAMVGTTAEGERLLMGGRLADTVLANQVSDVVSGGLGNDLIEGSGGGLHTYHFGLGDGADTLTDSSAKVDALGNATPNTLSFGEGIAVSDVRLSGHQGYLRIRIGEGSADSITLTGFDASAGAPPPIDLFQFADGTVLSMAQMLARGFDGDGSAEDISATANGDRMEGNGGDDTLRGAAGDDSLSGGVGDDLLIGGEGADTYRHGVGEGQDRIAGPVTGPAIDTLVFGAGITAGDIHLTHEQGDLWVQVGANASSGVRVEGFNGGQAAVASLVGSYVFADGTVLSHADLVQRGFRFSGTGGADLLQGTDLTDRFEASGGNDTLQGGVGSDDYHWQLDAGNDRVDDQGSAAQGLDRLVMGAGIAAADTRVSRVGNDLLVWVAGQAAQVRVVNHFGGLGIEQITFADSTVWDQAQIEALMTGLLVEGTPGDDLLEGDDTDDTLVGGLGNDTLRGGAGSDDYHWGPGQGDDRIEEMSSASLGTDQLALDASVTASNLRLMRIGDDLEVRVDGQTGVLRVAGQFLGEDHGIEQLRFSSGVVWDRGSIAVAAGIELTNGNDLYSGTTNNDYVAGLDGNDSLHGSAGNDTLDGGAGSDLLTGEAGDDVMRNGETMQGGSGNDVYEISQWPSGYLYIEEDTTAGVDVLRLPVASSEIRVGRLWESTSWANLDDLLLVRGGNENTVIVVRRHFLYGDHRNRLEAIEFSDGVVWDAAAIYQKSISVQSTSYRGHGFGDFIQMDGVRTYAEGEGGNDTIVGASINETIYGGSGNDILEGMDGSDSLRAEDGNDTLRGGSGNDGLIGGTGNDRYLVARGDGQDYIGDDGGFDALELTGGILSSDVQFFRNIHDLVIWIDQGQSQVAVSMYFLFGSSAIEAIQFSDGTIWGSAQIAAALPQYSADTMTGTAGDDLFVVDHVNDQILESADQGIDTVESAINYTLGSHLENLRLTGVIHLSGYGNGLNNHIQGNDGDNYLWGGGGADTLAGGLGNDAYNLDDANDLVLEASGEGFDRVFVNRGYTLDANVESLATQTTDGWTVSGHFVGNDLDNEIHLLDTYHRSTIDGGLGADTMISAADSVTFYVDNPNDRIVVNRQSGHTVYSSVSWNLDGLAGSKLILTGDGTQGLGGEGDDKLESTGAGNTLIGGNGNDTYTIVNSSVSSGPNVAIAEVESGGTQDEVIYKGDISTFYFSALEHIERIRLDDSTGASSVIGDERANALFGNASLNFLSGGAGNDYIESGGHAYYGTYFFSGDTISGGSGDDTILALRSDVIEGGTGNDVITIGQGFPGVAELNFAIGDGQDRVTLLSALNSWAHTRVKFASGIAAADLKVFTNGADLVLEVSPTDRITFADYFSTEYPYYARIGLNSVEFSSGLVLNEATILERLAAGNLNQGTTANDVIWGTDGGDTFNGAGGDDKIWGDVGSDLLSGDAGDDSIYAGGGADVLLGGDGADFLDGAQGDDSIEGGAGNDTIVYSSGQDEILFGWGDGQDSVIRVGYASQLGDLQTIVFDEDVLPDDVRLLGDGNSLQLSLGAGDDLIALAGLLDSFMHFQVRFATGELWGYETLMQEAATIRGDADANYLYARYSGPSLVLGLDGNDTLQGYYADDSLDGGAGVDSMIGSWGNDSYWVDNASDAAVELSGEGHDRVFSSITHTLRNHIEELHLLGSANLNGTGNSLGNRLVGNAGNNSLNGGSGSDTLEGGFGDDIYVVDNLNDVVVEAEAAGVDLVQASVSHALTSNVENLTLTGTASNSATGNDLANRLVGNSGANSLSGGFGDDTLDGGSGNDTMQGGVGNDTYIVAQSGDVVLESVDEGVDTVNASVTWTLGNHIENLTLTGSSAIHATGNSLDNLLTGNSGNNSLTGHAGNDTLNGGSGTDTMRGGAGDDTYFVERTADVVTESASEGTDTVQSTVTLTLAANVENIVLLGTSAIHGTGNTLNNQLTGNSGANSLTGAAGNDTLRGMAGSDTLIGGSGNDTYLLGRGDGAETVQENDATSGNNDILRFLEDVAIDQVWFRRVSNNLEVSIIGTNDRASITNWYTGSQYQLEAFQTSDGQALLNSQVDSLVQAMASFAPPAAGQTTLPPDYAQSLNPVIAANWN